MVNDFGKAPTIVGLHEPLYFEKHFIEDVVTQLRDKAVLVSVGWDEFSTAEKFAYEVLSENGWFGDER